MGHFFTYVLSYQLYLIAYILIKYYCAIITTNALSWQQQHVVHQKCVYTRRPSTLICQPIIILLILLSYRVITDSLNVTVAMYHNHVL